MTSMQETRVAKCRVGSGCGCGVHAQVLQGELGEAVQAEDHVLTRRAEVRRYLCRTCGKPLGVGRQIVGRGQCRALVQKGASLHGQGVVGRQK